MAKIIPGDTVSMQGEVSAVHDDGMVTVWLHGYSAPLTVRAEHLTLVAKKKQERAKPLRDAPDKLMTDEEDRRLIAVELYKLLDALDMPPELLSAINTWADDGDDEFLLMQLRAYNRTGSVFARVIKRRPE